jgi:oligopeptide/dipeptide ABC transporter ATP-binding protein
MVQLQRERGLTYVFISHDLSVVEHVSDVVAIMYLGRIVEMGPVRQIFDNPAHPYTRALMQAIPSGNPRQRRASVPLTGEAPSPMAVRPGCAFASRCQYAIDACRQGVPPLEAVGTNGAGTQTHVVACIRRDEIDQQAAVAVTPQP